MDVFFFAAHEALNQEFGWKIQFLMTSALAFACLAANFQFSAKQILLGGLVTVLASACLVFLNLANPKATLMDLFGIALPVFTFLTLVLPMGLLVFFAIEKLLKRSIVPITALAIPLLLGTATNIGLLSSISASYIRSHDYSTTYETIAYVAGHIFSNFLMLIFPALIAGALVHSFSRQYSNILFWFIWFAFAALTAWMNYQNLSRISGSLKFLYF